jgi:endonuclease/exonuclease/phosphatase family metal-dependent hydrolase
LKPIACDVPAEEFISDDGNYFLSDHQPVEVELAVG